MMEPTALRSESIFSHYMDGSSVVALACRAALRLASGGNVRLAKPPS